MSWRTLLAIDFDKWAAETYRANFPGVRVECGPVSDFIDTLPDADVVIGGPPCQPFSDAGENEGEKDDRDCIPDFIAAVRAKRPRQFLMENVRGLLKEKHLAYFGRVLTDLEALGYRVEYRLLDAVSFGVPQFRERVWVWGIRNDVISRHTWPTPTHAWPWETTPCMFGAALLPAVTVGQALELAGYMETGSKCRRDYHGTPRGPLVKGIENPSFTIDSRPPDVRVLGGERKGGAGHAMPQRDLTDEPAQTVSGHITRNGHPVIEYRWSDAMLEKHPPASPASPAPTVQAKYYKGGAEGLLRVDDPKHPVNRPDRPAVTQRGGGDGHSPPDHTIILAEGLSADGRPWDSRHPIPTPGEPMPTVRARSPRDGGRCTENVINDGLRVRRLTPLECLRLQSGSDDFRWPDGISKTQMYRIVGNGWACGMAAVMSRALKAADPDSRTVIDLFCGGGLGAAGWHGRYWSYQADAREAVAS